METWVWHTLGIEPTNDVKIIKKAYAAKAKIHHPEEHPDEYKSLQNAYKAAIAYAKNGIIPEKIIEEKTTEEKTTEEKSTEEKISVSGLFHYDEMPPVNTTYFRYNDVNDEDTQAGFWRHLQYFIRHPYVRNEYEFWKFFMNQPDVREIMKDKASWLRFIEMIKKENFKLQDPVLSFLDEYYVALQGDEDKKISNPVSSQLSPGFFRKILIQMYKGYSSDAEQKLYRALWTQCDERKRKNPKSYLDMYFDYAETNSQQLYSIHTEINQAKRNRFIFKTVRVILCLFIISLIPFLYRERQANRTPTVGVIDHELFLQEQNQLDETEELKKKIDEFAPSLSEHPEVLEILLPLHLDDEQLVNVLKELEIQYNETTISEER